MAIEIFIYLQWKNRCLNADMGPHRLRIWNLRIRSCKYYGCRVPISTCTSCCKRHTAHKVIPNFFLPINGARKGDVILYRRGSRAISTRGCMPERLYSGELDRTWSKVYLTLGSFSRMVLTIQQKEDNWHKSDIRISVLAAKGPYLPPCEKSA